MKTAAALAIAFLAAQMTPSSQQQAREATTVPLPVLNAERAWAGADVLLPLARSQDGAVAAAAIRALGRLEDRALIRPLLELANAGSASAADALAQTLQNVDPKSDSTLVNTVAEALIGLHRWDVLGSLAFADARQVSAVETMLDEVLERTEVGDENKGPRLTAMRAFESLVRRNARLPGFSLQPDTFERLEASVLNTHQNDDVEGVRLYALWTMIQGRGLTPAAAHAALTDTYDQVRRVAIQALGGGASVISDDDRAAALREAMDDASVLVRVEAVRSYAKRSADKYGCGPLLDALRDDSPHVVNVALDALGTACPKDDDVTTRLAAESGTPPTIGPWQRQSHAFVALAKRDGDRAAIPMQAFATHAVWQVRMYAARAASAARDEIRLTRLALDDSDNVRSTALPLLHALIGERALPHVLAALSRSDAQLLRTAANILKDQPSSHTYYRPLADALLRLSRDQRETSRDARLALLDAIDVHGTTDDAGDLKPLLKDVDPQVAARAVAIMNKWGQHVTADPTRVVHPATRDFDDLGACVAMEFANGRRMRIHPDPDAAPVTVGRFLAMAVTDHYYDGLTFHRVEPNFVIQGGSPGENEYSTGLSTFMRDEIGLPNVRGAVGLSTRGLNTADGQIYVMLVDDPRLDGRYTIFAHVFPTPQDMAVLDGIQEGDRIAHVTRTSCHP